MYPKLVALDTDWTIFSGSLDEHVWGKGRSASRKLSDNIQRVDDWSLRDRSNHDNEIRLNPDVPIIVNDILKNRSSLAIVSRNTSKALCDRALYYFKAMDPNTGEQKSIIQMVRYDEVVDEPKTKHFERIRGWSKFNYTDMILFDHEPENDIVETVLGVPIQVCGDQEGLTWEDYTRGIKLWSRIQGIISPYQGQHLQSYPRRKLIGYAALDSALVKLLESGRSIEDQSLARWGYGLYLTDNLAVAKFLRDQMKGAHIKAQVCSIWVRDAELFDTVAKIWVPEDNDLMTDPQSPNGVSTSQLQRDQKIETYGVQKPYVLFSKHQYIDGLPIRKGTRWNEMVVYTHVQNALILAYGMSDKEVANASQNPENASFDTLISEWNITVPEDTLEDFRTHGDTSEPPPPPPAGSTELRIAHFNDVYQVSDQKIQVDGKQENINVTKFATLLNSVTSQWKERDDGKKEGLILFSGDLFSPSVESSITRGRHMTSVIDALNVDVGVVGNHEFDFGYPRLSELVKNTAFPWLLSNIIDTDTNKVPEPLIEFHVLERLGIRIGFIGLVEEQWIATITGWPPNFKYQDMAKVGKDLSALLRDPAGPHKCDLIIALTHSRIPNDISLARDLFAFSPEAQVNTDITSQHGVDLLLGGHDHVYWIPKGIPMWDGYDVQQEMQDAASDRGDVLVVKSGTDFRDLSEVILTLKDTAAGSVRRKVIESIKGTRHVTRESTKVDENIKNIVDHELADINAAMKEPICRTETELDVQSSYIRLGESPIGNWIADGLRNVYDEALIKLGHQGTDGVIICTGDLRGDGVYPPGVITLGNLMTILPFLDPMVVLELDGNALWDAMESGLSKWPVQEGRFPAISGFRVSWDSHRNGGSRVLGIWLQEESKEVGDDGKPKVVDKEEVLRTSKRKYVIMVGQYMAEGGDGYDVLKRQKVILGEENGQSKSALIRKFLLGAQYLTKMAQTTEPKSKKFLHPDTLKIVTAAKARIRLPSLPKFDMPSIPDIQLPKSPGLSLPSPHANMPDLHLPRTQSLPFTTPKMKLPSMPDLGLPRSQTSPLPTSSSVKLPSMRQLVPQVPKNLQRRVSDIKQDIKQGPVGNVVQKMSDGATNVIDDFVQIAVPTLLWLASRELYSIALKIADREDMDFLDVYEQQRARRRAARSASSAGAGVETMSLRMSMATNKSVDAEDDKVEAKEAEEEGKDLPVIHPVVDGRLKDAGRV